MLTTIVDNNWIALNEFLSAATGPSLRVYCKAGVDCERAVKDVVRKHRSRLATADDAIPRYDSGSSDRTSN
ncbi:MAG: hypothetical protein R3A47_12170 [Polyangiales bacterium]